MKERGKKKKKRIDDRAARMELSDHSVPEESIDEEALEAQIRSQMGGVGAQLKRDDPDEMDDVYEQLRMDVTDLASEDDYEDESESEELLRRMPWLKYTAPEVLERASNRSYQYRGRRIGRDRGAHESTINPYAGEAFKEAVDELREKIMEAKESAEGEVLKRTRGKVYVPPMREETPPPAALQPTPPQGGDSGAAPAMGTIAQGRVEEPVVTFRPEPKPERMPPFRDVQIADAEPEPVAKPVEEVRFDAPTETDTVAAWVQPAENLPKDPAGTMQAAGNRGQTAENRVQPVENMPKDPAGIQSQTENRAQPAENKPKDPAGIQPPAENRVQPAENLPKDPTPPTPPALPTPPTPPTVQTATLPPVRRPVPEAPPAGPVPFTSSALFRTPDGLPAGDMRSPEGLPATDMRTPEGVPATDTQQTAQIDPAIKEDVRAFKQGIIDLDDDADTVERMKEKLENERFEAEEALAEEVIAEDGAEEAFDRADPVTNYAPEKPEGRKKGKKTLSAMERLKALAQTDEVEDQSVKGRRPKMTALDRLEQMEALDRQGIPYAAQHRVGEAGFQGMQMQQMQQMQMRQMMPMGTPMQPMNPAMMGGPMMGQPMMGAPMQPMNPAMMGQGMNPGVMGGPVMGQPVNPGVMGGSVMGQPVNPRMMGQPMMGAPMQPMNPAMMGQTMPLPQLPPMPPFTQGMPQNAQGPQGQPAQNPQQQSAGFDYNVSQGGGFDF